MRLYKAILYITLLMAYCGCKMLDEIEGINNLNVSINQFFDDFTAS
jgi:hypothetical protein